MKTNLCPQHRRASGSMLLVVMGTILVLGIALAGVLSLVMQEHRILARTAAWNTALPAAEAGIEEAMSHIRQVNGGNLATNGWVGVGTNFVFARNLSESQFAVAISSDKIPVITSIGYVWCPSAGKNIERGVQVTTFRYGEHTKAITSLTSITMVGTVLVDSFDSSDPLYSTNGLYTFSKHKDNGDIASNQNSPDAMVFKGKVQVYGSVSTGPDGTINDGGVAVGSTDFIDGGGTGIETNSYTKDMNVSFPSVTAPYTSGSTPGGGVVGGVTYKYILQAGIDYQLSSLVLKGGDQMLVSGPARLLVDKDVSLASTAFIEMAKGAGLEVYVKSGDVSMTGRSVVNPNGNAANFNLYALPQVTDIKISGGGTYTGTVYAPDSKLTLSGGGSDPLDFIGAAIAKQVDANGTYNFHYDEALGTKSSGKNLIVGTWKEL